MSSLMRFGLVLLLPVTFSFLTFRLQSALKIEQTNKQTNQDSGLALLQRAHLWPVEIVPMTYENRPLPPCGQMEELLR